MVPWQSAGRLTLDRDGILWRWADPGYRRLGPIEDVASDVADDLARPAAELLDAWRDAFDERAEQLGEYRLAIK